ncbi:G-patch domain-containing protein [Plasmodiophora brassicae]|uniref:G-patch domain-containing protein n=1 Tax=Plasmodiophora brassicae TaxID=37360 RepID=A0A0G4IUU8_PLABS|nr:hypothetical protein PBRA_007169 [Plasmodiophora brassicae]SPQ98610.1 unnamed protein product [Plasmodiophora brassicae]
MSSSDDVDDDGRRGGLGRQHRRDRAIYGVFGSDDDDEEARARFANRSTGQPVARAPVTFVASGGPAPPPPATSDAAAPPRRPANPTVKPAFEKHTKGFGSKYLEKFGFVDRLGKSGTGLAAPIEAKQRPTNMGLGFDGVDAKPVPKPKPPPKPKPARTPVQQWRRDLKQQQEVVYKTSSQMLEERFDVRASAVIDMTGPGGARTTTFDRLQEEETAAEPTLLPELHHNLKLLVEMTEGDIEKLERRRQMMDHEMANLRSKQEVMQARATTNRLAVERLEKVQAIVTQLAIQLDSSSPDRITVDAAADTFDLLRSRYAAEYREFHLEDLIHCHVVPILRDSDEPAAFKRWRTVMAADAYDALCEQVVIPRLRQAIAGRDLIVDSSVVASHFESWSAALSPSTTAALYDSIVIPRLAQIAASCDPLATPPHLWAHPWLPVLGQTRLQGVHDAIFARVSRALSSWKPGDPRGHAAVAPWRTVFSNRQLHRLMTASVVPALRGTARKQGIGAGDANFDATCLMNVLEWADLLPVPALLDILETSIWPRWLTGIARWMGTRPDYAVALSWFTRWCDSLPSAISRTASVQSVIRYGLLLLNAAVTGTGDLQLIVQRALQRMQSDRLLRQQPARPQATSAAAVPEPASELGSLRDLVSKYAEANDVAFIPNVRLGLHHGKQIFKFGTANIYIDHDCVYHLPRGSTDRDAWRPVTLSSLVQIARS